MSEGILSGSPLGVCVLPEPAPNLPRTTRYANYIFEILDHAGVCYERIELDQLVNSLGHTKVLVTVNEYPLPPEARARLGSWIEDGGCWLSIGGTCGMESLLGVEKAPPSFVLWGGDLRGLGEGYLRPDQKGHPVLNGLENCLHYFNGIAVTPSGAQPLASCLDAHQRPSPFSALLERAVGRGRAMLIAPDLTGAVAHMQQGNAVIRDGCSAPDGTAPVADGVLKSDDGQVLDWVFDRDPLPATPELSAFLRPAADQWRELFLRAAFYLASIRNVRLPLLWYYPEGRPAMGHLSHDTDLNDSALARSLLSALEKAGARATWCVILPGYPPELITGIRDAGHELAMHYDAMTPELGWGEAQFDRQWRELSEIFGQPPVTNKNHYLRWEGDTELWRWCVDRGIRLDQSKGASKTGEAGYNFGTCHLFRPITAKGEFIPLLVMATPTQDFHVFAPESLLDALLQSALQHHGILHLLFHPAHIEKPGVADSLARGVRLGRDAGLEWWTARELAEWEEARRSISWSDYRADESGASVTLATEFELEKAAILWLDPSPATPEPVGSVVRWGFRFHSQFIDLNAGDSVRITSPSEGEKRNDRRPHP